MSLFISSVYIIPSKNIVWNLLTGQLRALILLQTHVCLSSSPACVYTVAVPERRCDVPLHSALSWDAGSLRGAKWFLSLGKHSPSNLGPLRSIWINFTLTRRKTGNLRAGSGQEPSPQVKKGCSVSACVHYSIWRSVCWTCSHSWMPFWAEACLHGGYASLATYDQR